MKIILFIKNNKTTLFFLFFLALGLFLRLYRFDVYPFGFDQVQILENAQAIKEGHLRLIGPMTGPAQFYTGPLIYYIAVIWQSIINSPYLLVLTSASIYVFTGLFLIYLLKRYIVKDYQLIYFIVWALSPFTIKFDRVTWNPNLTLIAAFLVFFPLSKYVSQKKINILDSTLCFGGMFLGYQAHFSGLLLPLIAVLIWLLMIRKQFIKLLFCISGTLFSFIPTIIFDFRHDFLNTKGVLAFLISNQKSGEIIYIKMFWNNFVITIENIGKIIFEQNTYILIIFTGIICLSIFLLFAQKPKQQVFIILWLILSIIFISLYKKTSPEYYFIIQLPAILFIISMLLTKLLNSNKKRILFIIIFSVYSFLIIQKTAIEANSINLGNQFNTAKFLKNNNTYNIAKFEYDMEPVDQLGLKYLFRDFNFDKNGFIVHLVYPHLRHGLSDKIFGPLAVWFDPREQNHNYLELSSLIVSIPLRVKLYQNYQDEKLYNVNSLFSVLVDKQKIGNLIVIDRRLNEKDYERFSELLLSCDIKHNCQNTDKHWTGVVGTDGTAQLRREMDTLLIFYPDHELTSDQSEQVNQIAVIKK